MFRFDKAKYNLQGLFFLFFLVVGGGGGDGAYTWKKFSI